MKVVVCACGARNVVGGDCIICGAPLGSPAVAVAAAAASALGLALLWALTGWLTGVQALWFGMFFGVAVSGAVAHFSFGRGWLYQAISSGATLGGIVLGETLLLLLLHGRLGSLLGLEQPNLGLLEAVRFAVVDDAWSLVFGTVGLLGGFWVWKQPDPAEDA
ncbi:MAG: hypothetical protein M9894_09065 [Planctomycetes bacterium]|nr:hypothetical protein [Planctomycetota bacterium]